MEFSVPTERKLYAFRTESGWAYDDPRVPIENEPFVDGAELIIEHLLANPHADRAVLRFSDREEYPHVLEYLEDHAGGATYLLRGTGMKGWLCVHLFDYFDTPPKRISISVTEYQKP